MSNLKEELENLPQKIETERLIIKKYKQGEGKDLFALLERNNNRDFLREHVDEATDIITLEDAEKRVRYLEKCWDDKERFVMGMWFKSNETFIGNIWIEPNKWDVPSFELGYFLDKGYIRKGIASEATIRAVKFIFEELQAHKIIILTRDTNIPSYKLAERIGFIREGHIKENIKDGDKRLGLFHYSLLKREYLDSEIYK